MARHPDVLPAAIVAVAGSAVTDSRAGRHLVRPESQMRSTATTVQTRLVDLLATAVAGQFTTWVTALTTAGLVETLNRGPLFTMFAPTDRAFAALPKGLWNEWLKPENRPALRALVKGHVVAGRVTAADVLALPAIKTCGGSVLAVRSAGTAVTVAGAALTRTDVMASNGVIHGIDAVILPKPPAPVPAAWN